MLEVNAVYFILLAEGFAVLLCVLLAWGLFGLLRSRRKSRDVVQLAQRIHSRADQRREQTQAFLQAVYGLENPALAEAVDNIEHSELEFFRQLLDSLERGQSELVTSLDVSLDSVFESYKCLQPRPSESAEEDAAQIEITSLRGENEQLREELSLARNKVSDMLIEFGNMFGGGKDHELATHEVMDRLSELRAENDASVEAPPETESQK